MQALYIKDSHSVDWSYDNDHLICETSWVISKTLIFDYSNECNVLAHIHSHQVASIESGIACCL